MTKRIWSVALVLGLVLAACGSKSPGAETVKTSFVPQTVDFLDDVGRGVSLALDKDGNPHLAYIGLVEKIKKGEIPPARSASAPALPAVLTASEKGGIFSHGFVVQTDISSANGAKIPVDESSTTGIAVAPTGAVDVVWNQVHGVFFATAPTDTAPFGDPQTVTQEYGTSPAVAVDSKGNPWVAWVQQERLTGVPLTLQAATLQGKTWTTEKVGDLGTCGQGGCAPITAGIAMVNDEPVLAYTNAGGSVFLATRGATGWSTQTVQQDAKAYGASLAVDKDGSIHVAYETTDGEVRQAGATGPQATWNVSTVGTFTAPTSTPARGTRTAVATDPGGTTYVAYADPQDGSVVLASSANGGQFGKVDTPGTDGGSTPAMAVNPQHKANLAWYATVPQDLELGIFPEQLGAYALPAPTTPASPPATGGGGGQKCPKDTVEIVAPVGAGGAGFQTTAVTASSGDFTLCFNNQDPSAPHDVQIFESPDGPNGSPVAQDTPFQGPKIDTFDVSGLSPGDHYFHCVVHPGPMHGILTVK
ncbi:MAG: hypothetical protein ACJ77A_18490 [Actinomycetota bacterium]